MPFTRTGSDIALTRNPATGKYDFTWGSDGNPDFDDTEHHRVLTLLVSRRGQWVADTAGTRGSRIHEVREIRRTAPSLLESYADEALEKAVAEGKIQNVVAKATRSSPSRVDLDVQYERPGGKPQSVRRSING